jgi:hypothetical protein
VIPVDGQAIPGNATSISAGDQRPFRLRPSIILAVHRIAVDRLSPYPGEFPPRRDFDRPEQARAPFTRAPSPGIYARAEAAPYGYVVVFEDLYGNLWDLVQFAADGR